MEFFDTFVGIKLNKEQAGYLDDVDVVKITRNKARGIVRVYIESSHIIPKTVVFDTEKSIKNQYFSADDLTIRIEEKYSLSNQYNLNNLYDIYKEHLMEDIRNFNKFIYKLVKQGNIEINDNTIYISLPDTFGSHEYADEIEGIFYKVFKYRFGFDLAVKLDFSIDNSEKAEAVRKKNEEEIQKQVAAIIAGRQHIEEEKKEKEEKKEQKEKEKEFKKSQYTFKKKLPDDDPDMIYGRNFEGDEVRLEDVFVEDEEIVANVQIINTDMRETRNGKFIFSMSVTDLTDSIGVKLFLTPEKKEKIEPKLKAGKFIKIKGTTSFDKFDNELTLTRIVGIKEGKDFSVKRMDDADEKRVELHLHTMMSDMDGFIDPKKLIQQAIAWGHKAVAITDHGVVQGFTDAFHKYCDIKSAYKKEDKELDFKIIYGMEGYLVDDLKELVKNSKGQSLDDSFVVFDLETTGLSKYKNNIIEIGAVKVENGEITDRFSTFVNPREPIPYKIEKLTSINDSMVEDAPFIEEVLPKFLEFCKGCVLVAHKAEFDVGFIEENSKRLGLECDFTVADTLTISRAMLTGLKNFKLDTVAKELGVVLNNHHRAVDDAECTAGIFIKLCARLKKDGIEDLDGINKLGATSDENIRKLKSYHIILLAKNDIGRVNLYRLCSMSHLKYFSRNAKIPKSQLIKYREGLIIGSACEAGELYRAILDEKSDDEIVKIAQFYDYLEIQPLGNNAFMVKRDGVDNDKARFDSMKDIEDINKRIVKLGEALNKPVVATCDAHFMNPEDEIYRRIIMAGKGFADADDQAPLYYRTTNEMLDEFKYLGEDKAYEVVVTNTNLISDMIENIDPVRPDKCPPVIENSDQTLREICYNKAHSMYGEELPSIVKERLDKELNSIISNGYAVMYIIAQKLVWKSNEDGYLVGSRGSVGSSFVATMSGITEVNPLKAHYYCKSCHYSDFELEGIEHEPGCSGCDLPDRNCPVCGEPLVKDGFNIPFETFLGFKGDKEPDIDLNFSGEYQAKAHDYTEVIFGKGQTFRAGTIGTLQDKTAYGFIKKYYEERGVSKRSAEIDRIVQGCVGVRRTTGQHPGGIIVLPLGEDINSFTPVQHPADDINSTTITTHFDYHSIDHNLLKLDILGHDDPTMIKKLESLTGLDAKSVKFDDAGVLSLFESTEALGVTPEEIDCPLGSLGIPEFGTDFVIQMLRDTKPKTFSDLVRISGLSHGTDVWLNNAQTLIENGDATISTAICTRDDIMTYLIQMGVEPSLSFTIMEAVRKGKGLKPEWEEEMTKNNVPDWYIWSCKRIKYMFPKAHAVAYVMMAFRIAYFKINYPLAYYAAFFSIRASAFNYELMCLGKSRLEHNIAEFKKKKEKNEITAKEEDTLKDMRLVMEMYARGFDFMPIDVYRAKANDFQIIDGKIMPSFSSIDGMGDKAAEGIEEAAKDGKFISLEDFKNRTKVSQSVIDSMVEMGILKGLPKQNQMSLFDFV